MKFKHFLLEKASYYKTIIEMMSEGRIPLTDKITQALGYGRDAIAYHATTIEHLKNLSKIGKTKKQLSTFSHGLGSLLGAISVKPDVIAKLEGRSVIDFSFDIFSHPDKDGRRWIGIKGNKKSKFLQEAINTKPINLIYDLLSTQIPMKYSKDKFLDKMLYDESFYQKQFNMLNGKDKSKVIQLYISNILYLVQNPMYENIVKEIINGSNKNVESYDEIIMNRFKVIGVYSVENGRYAYDTSMAQYDIEKQGYKYLGHINKDEFNNFGKS